ncbi:MAG: polyprenyl synthetase family protein [Actinomycetota bacterium]
MASLSPLQRLDDDTAQMERVEAALKAAVTADDQFLTEVASHLIIAGGKRLRPAFVIASGTCLQPTATVTDDLVQAGVSVELVHLGSLYHDDVIDEADMRRTVETVNHRWSNLTAILSGDFLLAKASEIAASLGTEVAGLLAATIAQLCEGQVVELQRIYDVGRTEEQYLSAIEGKTAALYATSCRIGAIVSGFDRDLIDRLTEFGRLYGMAFQVIDDVLDITATEEQIGKPPNDVVEGVYTLPVIRHLAAEPDGVVASMLGTRLDEEDRDKVRSIVASSEALASSIVTADEYCVKALDLVADLPDSQGADGMRAATRNLLASLP